MHYKTAFMSAVLFMIVFSASGDIPQSGRTVPDFNKIEVSGNISVFIEKSGVNYVTARAGGGSTENISVNLTGSTLVIRQRPGLLPASRTELSISAGSYLSELRVSAGARAVSYRNIFAASGEISALSGSMIDVYADTDVMVAAAGRNSRIAIKGRSGTFDARAMDGGFIEASDFPSQKVFASARTGGSLRVNAEKELDAGAGKGSVIYYRGEPEKIYFSAALDGEYKKLDE